MFNFPVRSDNPYRADVPALLELVGSRRPDLVLFGKSMFLYPEPVRELCQLVADWPDRPLVMYDMAHVLGLYGAFQTPFEEGVDVVTGSTHKTFFGPQRGVIAADLSGAPHPLAGLWAEIENRAFPGSTSNHHLGTLLGLLAAAYEMNEFREAYQSQVLRNARAFAAALAEAGVEVEGDSSDGYTRTHQVICRVRDHGGGEEVARRLERSGVIVNYQALPDDRSFTDSSGIRLGVAEMTRFGMQEDDFVQLAGLMAEVILDHREQADRVARARSEFCDMHFCLEPERAAELGARLLASLLPDSAYVDAFASELARSAVSDSS